MAVTEILSSDARTVRATGRWFLASAGLLLASAALQLVASFERWVVFAGSWTRDDVTVEDHRFDYAYPADPWENLGTTAQLFGAGSLLLALGVLAMARASARRDHAVERVLVIAVAGSFALSGVHALVSGVIGAPTPLQGWPVQTLLALTAVLGLVLLGARWPRGGAGAACILLLGATAPGHLLAALQIAPAIAGYQSHDTTPWTETVVAASTALAGMVLLVAAGVAARPRDGAVHTAARADHS